MPKGYRPTVCNDSGAILTVSNLVANVEERQAKAGHTPTENGG